MKLLSSGCLQPYWDFHFLGKQTGCSSEWEQKKIGKEVDAWLHFSSFPLLLCQRLLSWGWGSCVELNIFKELFSLKCGRRLSSVTFDSHGNENSHCQAEPHNVYLYKWTVSAYLQQHSATCQIYGKHTGMSWTVTLEHPHTLNHHSQSRSGRTLSDLFLGFKLYTSLSHTRTPPCLLGQDQWLTGNPGMKNNYGLL